MPATRQRRDGTPARSDSSRRAAQKPKPRSDCLSQQGSRPRRRRHRARGRRRNRDRRSHRSSSRAGRGAASSRCAGHYGARARRNRHHPDDGRGAGAAVFSKRNRRRLLPRARLHPDLCGLDLARDCLDFDSAVRRWRRGPAAATTRAALAAPVPTADPHFLAPTYVRPRARALDLARRHADISAAKARLFAVDGRRRVRPRLPPWRRSSGYFRSPLGWAQGQICRSP